MLVFELTADADELEIHADEEGIQLLKRQLNDLLAGELHIHLKTKAWGGEELSEEAQATDHKVINHVKIFCWHK